MKDMHEKKMVPSEDLKQLKSLVGFRKDDQQDALEFFQKLLDLLTLENNRAKLEKNIRPPLFDFDSYKSKHLI